MSELLAIIGGTGLTSLDTLKVHREETVTTPYGEPSGPLVHGELADRPVVFLPRHGPGHRLPPHRVNYRANVAALKQVGVTRIIAVAAVGGITPQMSPERLVFPDQLIDYTHGRTQTFFEDAADPVVHVDFSYPYSDTLRMTLIEAARELGLQALEHGVYGATQGPRLETAAEITRMERDGCDLVGMTGMPEAVLARELDLDYATCAVVVNWAAGKTDGVITMDQIQAHLGAGMEKVKRLLTAAIPRL